MIHQQAQRRTRRPLLWLRALLISLLITSGTIITSASSAQASQSLCGSYGDTPSFNCVSYSGFTGQQPWGYPVDSNGHNCTNYVSYRLSQNGATNPGNLGNAHEWDNRAATYGIPVNGTAAVGSVAVWEINHAPAMGSGHVAYVEAVTSSYIDISEDNYGGTTMRKRFFVGQADWPDHFVHIKDVASGGSTSHGLLAPSAITDPVTGRNIFYVGADGYIWQWSLQNGQWVNFKLTTPSGGQAVAPNTSPTAIYDPTSGRNVFYVGADKAIWQWYVQNDQWVNFRLGGSVASDSSPSAVVDPSTGRNIFYVGANGSINQWSIQNGQWTNVNLGGTALGGTSPSAVVDPTTGRNVFYVGLDSKISQWSVQNGQWTNVALNGAGGNKTVASHSSPSAVVDTTTGRNVFYVGSDSFIYQWSVQNGQWTNFALTGTGGNQPAAQYSSPSAVVDPSTGRNIFYVGANGQIYQWSIQNSAWNNFMLTGAGGNAAVDSNTSPGAVIDTSTGTDRNIFYFNAGRVYQWSIHNGPWTNFQLQ